MKKLTIGALMLIANPFIVLIGAKLIHTIGCSLPEGAVIFACILGGASVIFNFGMGIALIIKGHQESKTFNGW